jgi:hypothetical protein
MNNKYSAIELFITLHYALPLWSNHIPIGQLDTSDTGHLSLSFLLSFPISLAYTSTRAPYIYIYVLYFVLFLIHPYDVSYDPLHILALTRS